MKRLGTCWLRKIIKWKWQQTKQNTSNWVGISVTQLFTSLSIFAQTEQLDSPLDQWRKPENLKTWFKPSTGNILKLECFSLSTEFKGIQTMSSNAGINPQNIFKPKWKDNWLMKIKLLNRIEKVLPETFCQLVNFNILSELISE